MSEFPIKLPDLKDGQRILSAAGRKAAAASTQAAGKAAEIGGKVKDRVDDIKAPTIHILEARRIVRDTNDRLTKAAALLQDEHDNTAAQLARLGEVELAAYDGPIRDFVDLFARIKHVHLSDLDLELAPEFVQDFDIDVRSIDFSAVDGLKAVAAGNAAGAAAGLTAFAAVGTFATASTGTAITTLSGAAATNATLAWLGGGTIAAGGSGVAGGMMVLGGIVALPVLAVGGIIVHHKGRRALAEAKADAAKADVTLAEMETARTVTHGIRHRAERITGLVQRLTDLATRRNAVLGHLVDRADDYATYDDHDRKAVMVSASVVKTLRTVIDVPVIDDDGSLTAGSRQAIEAAEQLLVEPAAVDA